MNEVNVQTKPCIECGLTSMVTVSSNEYDRWRAGEHVQNVWPEMPLEERELLITGTHPACWAAMFEEEAPDAGQ